MFLNIKNSIKNFLYNICHPIKYFKNKKNVSKYGVGAKSGFIDPNKKELMNNIGKYYSFYLKHKKNGRTIVLRSKSWNEINDKYGEEYSFVEPMIKDCGGWWDGDGKYHKE